MVSAKIKNIPITNAERTAWLRLFRTKNVGVITFQKLLARYGTAIEAINALPDLAKRGGASKPLKPPAPQYIEKERKALHKLGGRTLTLLDPEYPETLKAIPDAPPIISVIGNLDILKQTSIAMVGARNASLNGRKFAQHLARDLGNKNQIITSGPNKLIRDGATLIRNADDVLENLIQTLPLGFNEPANIDTFEHFADDTEIPENAQGQILDNLSYTPTAIDELLRTCDVSIPAMQTILLELELAGRIKRLPGNRVSLIE